MQREFQPVRTSAARDCVWALALLPLYAVMYLMSRVSSADHSSFDKIKKDVRKNNTLTQLCLKRDLMAIIRKNELYCKK